jgi:adenylate cyclase
VISGEPARAIEVLSANLRVDPFQFRRLGPLRHAYCVLRRYEEAVPPLRECASSVPNMRGGHLWLAAAYAQLGQLAEARVAAADVLRIEPAFTIDNWKRVLCYRNHEDAKHFLDGLPRRDCHNDRWPCAASSC